MLRTCATSNNRSTCSTTIRHRLSHVPRNWNSRIRPWKSRWEQDAPLPDLSPAQGESTSKNAMTFNARAQLARVIGVDLVAVRGLSASTVQTIISVPRSWAIPSPLYPRPRPKCNPTRFPRAVSDESVVGPPGGRILHTNQVNRAKNHTRMSFIARFRVPRWICASSGSSIESPLAAGESRPPRPGLTRRSSRSLPLVVRADLKRERIVRRLMRERMCKCPSSTSQDRADGIGQ